MAKDGHGPVPTAPAPPAELPAVDIGDRIPIEDFGVGLRIIRAEDMTDAEVNSAIELLRLAFNGGPGWFALPVPEADHLRWKLIDPPFEGRAIMVHEDTGRLVGFSGRLLRRWMVRGEVHLGRDGVESALHPDYQGSGLYTRRSELSNAYPREEDFRISFGSHPISLLVRKKKGTPNLANPLDNLVRPLDVAGYVRRRAAGDGRPTGSRTRIAIEGKRRRLPRPTLLKRAVWHARLLRQRLRHRPLQFYRDDFTIRTVERFDDRIEQFFEAAARPFALIQVRDQATLNWRYADRRAGPFTIRIAEVRDEIVGYAVTRATDEGASLADVLALPDRDDVAHALIQDAMHLGRRAGSPAIRSWMLVNHPYHRLLLHNGFLPIRRIVRPAFTDHGNTKDYGFMHDPHARIHIMLGDTDHI